VNSLELEYEDENATGWIRCSGECTNKNKPFSAKGLGFTKFSLKRFELKVTSPGFTKLFSAIT